jgi:DHA3 family tetracycline resistance protein-like MFS transporter
MGGSGLLLLALYLLIAMPETAFTPVAAEERLTLAGMSTTLRQGMGVIRNSPMLQTMLVVALFYGLSSEGIDRLWEAHLLENFDLPGLGALEPIYWFGILNGCVMLLTIGSTELLRRRADSLDGRRLALLLAAMTSVLIGGLLIFGLAPAFGIAIGAYVILALVRNTMSPLLATWYNRGIPSPVRATVLSTIGQMDAVGQVVGGPPMGAFATRFGLRAMFVLIALLLAPVLALYARAISLTKRRGKVD